MKVLLDTCVWGGAAEVLRAADHEVESASEWPRDPGDAQILDHALHHAQVVITLDKDLVNSRLSVACLTTASSVWLACEQRVKARPSSRF